MYLKINTAGNTTSALLLDLFVWPQAVSYLLIKVIAVFWNFTVFPHKKSTPWRVRKIKLLYLILSLFFFFFSPLSEIIRHVLPVNLEGASAGAYLFSSSARRVQF